MSTKLEQATEKTKKIFIGCSIFVIAVLMINLVISIFKKDEEIPPIYPQTADESFKTLPKISFDNLEITNPNEVEYILDTVDGKVPLTYIPVTHVFKNKTPYQSLTAYEDSVNIAKKFDFTTQPQTPSETELVWTSGIRSLTINKLYKTVDITVDFKSEAIQKLETEITQELAYFEQMSSSILKSAGLSAPTKAEARYIKLNPNGTFSQVNSTTEADFVRIDFYNVYETLKLNLPEGLKDEEIVKYTNEYGIFSDELGENPKEGIIYMILGGATSKDVYFLKYSKWEIEKTSDYYLIGTKSALEEVQKGNGFIRFLKKTNESRLDEYVPLDVKSFNINNIEIAYYSNSDYIDYIQPMYVFSGIALLNGTSEQADFIIYYPAIKNVE